MNKKNKVLLTSVGLAMLSGIAATGSTFAWFTTTRTASISYSSATVTTDQSNMVLTYVDGNVTSGGTDNELVLTGANKVTDISGDGLAFFKPVWSATDGVATSIAALANTGPADANGYWVEFTVKISINGETDMNVYLGEDTKITANAAGHKNAQAVLGSRMAVVVGGVAEVIYAPDVETTYSYLSAASATPVIIYGSEPGTAATKGSFDNVANSFTTLQANATGSLGFVSTIAAGDDLDVTFRVWLEGEDPDTTNVVGADAVGGVFDIDIDLYALEA